MTFYPRFQSSVQDQAGNIIPAASVTVTRESDGALMTLYADKDGVTPIGNPIYTDLNGFFYFHLASGVYKIVANSTFGSVTWRYVEILDYPLTAAGPTTIGDIATWNATDGTSLGDSGKSLSTDGTFASNSDAKVPTEKAVKTYVDALATLVSGALVFKGSWDASAGTFPGAGVAQTGWFYKVSVAGTVNGQSVDVGDDIYAIVNNASTTTYAGNWLVIQGVLSSAEIVAALATNALALTKLSQGAARSVVGVGGNATANRADITATANSSAVLREDGAGNISFGTVATAGLANNAVDNTKLAQMATLTVKGNNTGGTANALDLTMTQLTAMLNALVGDSGSGGTKGAVPAPAAGDASAGKYLRADATWAVPSGSATGWALIQTQTVTTSVASVIFNTSVSSYNELMLCIDQVSANGAANSLQIQVSVDNGSTFLNADIARWYPNPNVNETRSTTIQPPNSASSALICGTFRVINLAVDKRMFEMWQAVVNTGGGTNNLRGHLESGTSLINYIKVTQSGGNIRGDLATSVMKLYGRL